VIPLGHRTYLDAKVKGENSMSEKVGCMEAISVHARQDPDDMVKARLPEPKCPHSKDTDWIRWLTSNVSETSLEEWSPETTCSRETGLSSTNLRTRNGHLKRPERHSSTKCGIA
jgi:hypothetical protein